MLASGESAWDNALKYSSLGLALAWAATANAAPQASGPASTTLFEVRLQAAVQEIQAQNLSVIVGVSHNGGETRLYEFGALTTDDIPPEATQVDINSITKTVTAVAVAKLAEQGRLRFDERLDEIFPDVPHDKAGITVHHLLTHSAGLPESVGEDGERLGREELLNRLWVTDLQSRPGATYAYSNAGYGLLAAIVEVRSGKPFETYLREDVLPGERLPNTGYETVFVPERSARTRDGRTIRDASWGGHEPYWNLIGNGGLISTVPEMIAFLGALKRGELIAPQLLQTLLHPHMREGDNAKSFYGYGLVVDDVPGVGRIYWHDGGNDVFTAWWADFADAGDILFTAGQGEDAFAAASILAHYLFRIDGHAR